MKKEQNLTVKISETLLNILCFSSILELILGIISLLCNCFLLSLITLGLIALVPFIMVIFLVFWFLIIDPIIEWRNKKLNKLNSLKENENEAF